MCTRSGQTNGGWFQSLSSTASVLQSWSRTAVRGGPVAAAVGLGIVAALVGGCASDNGAQSDEDGPEKVVPPITSTRKGDQVIRRFDVNDDGRAEIEKVYDIVTPDGEQTSDGGDSTDNNDGGESSSKENTREVLREKRIDVNEDGTYDIVRFYKSNRKLVRERVDIDRDGNADWVSYFDEGTIARKEMLADDGSTVTSSRYYDGEGELERVEVDRNDDGKIDYWEYYESGSITRVGRDVDGDEEADSWDRRRKQTTAGSEGPALGEGASSDGETDGNGQQDGGETDGESGEDSSGDEASNQGS